MVVFEKKKSVIGKGDVHIFYHIACLNNWRQIVERQLNRIKNSELYDVVKNIHCFLISPQDEKEKNVNFVENFSNKIIIEHVEEKGDESVTLSRISKITKPGDKFLYFHTKGVTHYGTEKYPNVVDWSKVMEYFLIDRFHYCLRNLNDYEAVGINFLNVPLHFSGNFWWTTHNYFIQLDGVEGIEDLLFKKNPKYLSLFQTGLEGYGHYNQPYPESEYVEVFDKFIFHLGVDQINNDLYRCEGKITDFFRLAYKDPKCLGFNSLGYFKNKTNNLTYSPYFSESDGIFIKKKNGNIRIKMICNWCTSEQLCEEWSNMAENGYQWGNLEMVSDDQDIDYYVIINSPPENSYYNPQKTIIFQMEPWVSDPTKNWGVKTWGQWAQPDETKFFHVHSHQKYLNCVQWQKSPAFLSKNRENHIISIISEKIHDDGHIKRINFIKNLENDGKNLIYIYGRQNYHQFKNYLGQTDKSHLGYYKYCFSVENNSEINYATEKIWEPILHEMLTFYWGCPNLENYIDSRAFVRLDLDNYEESLRIIVKIKSDKGS